MLTEKLNNKPYVTSMVFQDWHSCLMSVLTWWKYLCFHQSNSSISQPACLRCYIPPTLTYLSLHPFPYPPPYLHFFLSVHFPLTMGGLRLLHVVGVSFLRVIAGPGAHRNIQINAMVSLPLKSVLNPTDAGRVQDSRISCLTPCIQFEFKCTSTV